ncbi:MAG: hypothetical protein PF489_04790 [Salinivirgaceae bacterium]|jgi:hypothetical protein|nr:hypothetical protein [Salinivirgaceae bacterium]
MENKLAVLKTIRSLNSLKNWLVDAGLVEKVLEQIEKDFAQFGLSVDIHADDIIETMQRHVDNLLHTNYQQLQNLLYRIDIHEKKMIELQQLEVAMPERDVITLLIIQREAEKVFFKEFYKTR